jgi:predicted ATPase
MTTTAPANGRPTTTSFLRRVKVRNFKSLGNCDVELGALTVLVGRNGSGKSNFIDALRFVSDALRMSAGDAIVARGNFDIVRKGKGSPRGFDIELEVDLRGGCRAVYGFAYEAPDHDHSPRLVGEHLEISEADNGVVASYAVKNGRIETFSETERPPVPDDRLYLVNASGFPAFRAIYDALRGMRFYQLSPLEMSAPKSPSPGEILKEGGENIAGVIERLSFERPRVKERILGYLATIVPGLEDVRCVHWGRNETIEFVQKLSGSDAPQTFHAKSMSNGTLRALGALVAITQPVEGTNPVLLVGIEEPEAALHPAAAGALMDALREAAARKQVIVTTHSPDLLDQIDPDTDRLLVAQIGGGGTMIGPIDQASRQAIREDLYTPGDLLGMDQLELDWADPPPQTEFVESAGPSE